MPFHPAHTRKHGRSLRFDRSQQRSDHFSPRNRTLHPIDCQTKDGLFGIERVRVKDGTLSD
jgi:hypothetical protein